MFNRPRYITIGALVLLLLAVLNLPRGTAARLKLAVGGIFLPLFGLANTADHLAEGAQTALEPRQALVRQLEQLRQENQALKIQALQGAQARRENDRLRDALGTLRGKPWQLKYARVLGRDPSNWWRSLQIDLGTAQGARPNLTVLTPEGLVGRISEAAGARAQVLLVGDPNCKVAVWVLKDDGRGVETEGMIVPCSTDPLDDTLVDLTYVPRTSTLRPGQTVVTSGQGGVFPEGIPIGKIVDTRSVELGLYKEARVKMAVSYSRLEEVWVILP